MLLSSNMRKLINLRSFKDFFNSSSSSGIVLFSCLIISLLIANSPLGNAFNMLLEAQVGYENDAIHLRYPVAF